MFAIAAHRVSPTHRVFRAFARDGCRWMSAWPGETPPEPTQQERKKVTIQTLQQRRRAKTPITMLTAYDFPTGRACDAHGVDITLVGDSLAQVCLGYDSTTRLTLDEMVHHCRAVSRGSARPLLVADMPFGTYHAGAADAVRSAVRLVREGRAEAVKIEGGREVADTVRRLTEVGIPVMGHVGLMPQRHVHLSGYRVQGRRAEAALGVLRDAAALERAGAFAVVLEAVPAPLGALVTEMLRSAVTIGIGAGAGTDGQVLVWDDVMGTWAGHRPVFARRFAEVGVEVGRGIRAYAAAVREGSFPAPEETYDMPQAEWEETRRLAQEWMRAQEEENGRTASGDSG